MRAFDAVAINRVPSFIRDDFPAMEEFIQAYFEFLQENYIDKADFKTIRDIEKSLDEYLIYFKNTLAKGIPNETAADYRTVLANIRELFKSKGTEKSIKFFFKALFNETAEVFYPRSQIFTPSDSTWIRNRVIKVTGNITPAEIKEKQLTFTNGRLYVEDCYSVNGVFVLTVSDIVGKIEDASSVFLGTKELIIQKQVVGFKIVNSGSIFVPDTVYELDHGVKVSIKTVKRGKITAIDVIDGGTGYNGTEEIIFTQNGPYGKTQGLGGKAKIHITGDAISSVDVLDGGSLFDLPPGLFCESTGGNNAILRASGLFGGIKEFSIVDGGFSLPSSPWSQPIGDAEVIPVFGNVAELEGSFFNTIGFPSSGSAYLQDEHYYQYFSYVIRSGVNVNQYFDIFKRLVHPAGMRLFSQFVIDETVSVFTQLESSNIILDIFSDTSAPTEFKETILALLIATINQAGGLRREQIDIYKYDWFAESSYINRWKTYTIRELSQSPGINPEHKEVIGIQPDAVINIINVSSLAGFGGSIGNQVIGNTDIG